MARYPAELEQPGLLRDGRSVMIRPVLAADEEAMLDFSRRLSRRTLAQRLLGPVPRFHRELLRQFVDVDYADHFALVAFLDDQMIGVGRLIRYEDTDHAEVTFTIADEFQGVGLGMLLLERLTAAAPGIGVYVLEADVLTSNAAMLRAFAASGYPCEITAEGHLQHVVLRVDPRASALARMSRREHQAARRSLEKLLMPRAVAVIGANRQPDTIGHQILVNLIERGFPGPVYPVNPAASEVAGRPEALADVIRDCAEAKAGAVVLVTADFSGDTAARRAAGQDITRCVRPHGMRMVGPTSMGVLSTRAGSAMHATFGPVQPPAGAVAMSSQSGPLGLAILDLANRAGLGFSCFVSIGAAADVSSNDLLEWWEDDPQTGVIRSTWKVSATRGTSRASPGGSVRKPVVAVTPGSDPAGGALLAQAGVIHTTALEDMFDVALLLANQPVPAGNRVAIVTNAIDPGVLAAACTASGLTSYPLSLSHRSRCAARTGAWGPAGSGSAVRNSSRMARVHTDLVCGPENEGGPDVAHGGWTAGVFDEVLGHVTLLNGELAVTGQLSVSYLKPGPVGRPLHARAWTVRRERHRWYVADELILASTGAVLGRGEAVMVLRDVGHFALHQEWLAQQDLATQPQQG